jgi:aryl-alcohol dehydrogenase-like predicted oxidoreductase
MAKSSRVIPIPGTKHRKYLEQNIAACTVDLTRDEIATLDNLFKSEAIAGDRYYAEGMKLIDL